MEGDNSGGKNSQESSPKRTKTHQNNDPEVQPDRLSELPEHLLVRIISLLTTEEAVRTSVLSTRWRTLWTLVDKLDFRYDMGESSPQDLQQFITFVDHTLNQLDRPKIQEFSLVASLYHDEFDHNVLDRWIQWAYLRNVECLKVRIPGFSYTNPEWFYNSTSLVSLSIYYDCTISILGQVSWTSLKSLTLSYVYVDDVQIAKILSGCPMLEDLNLFEVLSFKRLNITSRRLEKLTVVNFEETAVEGLLEINAPWVKILGLYGYFDGTVIKLIDVSSLTHVTLNIRHDIAVTEVVETYELHLNSFANILQSVHQVEELTFGPEVIQVLSNLLMWGRACPSFKCKRLKLHLPIMKYELPGIIYLLHNSPHLESLIIELRKDDFNQYLDSICDFDVDEYLNIARGNLQHLRNIEVSYSKYACSEDDENQISDMGFFDFELTAYILRNTSILEKLVITSDEDFCDCERNCTWPNVSQLVNRLLENCIEDTDDVEITLTDNLSYFEVKFL